MQKKSPSAMRGIVAGLVVVVLGAVTLFMFSGDEGKVEIKPTKQQGQIKEVKPAAVAKPEGMRPESTTNAAPVAAAGANKRIAKPIDRKQIFGSERRRDESIKAGKRCLFRHTSESFLAMYAIPGEPIPPMPRFPNFKDDVANALVDSIEIEPEDTEADIQLKEMVAGMKEELKQFIRDGGTVDEFFDALEKRQQKEAEYYQDAYAMVWDAVKGREGNSGDQQEAYDLWKKMNEHLNEKGIKTIPLPRPLWKRFKNVEQQQ